MDTPDGERKLLRLVNEMGFPRSEAIMALGDCNGNSELAVERLVSGKYAPPPYTEMANKGNANLTLREGLPTKSSAGKQNQSANEEYFIAKPPPYSTACLKEELKGWEESSSADFFKLDKASMGLRETGLRCSSCFDEIFEQEKSGPFNKAVKDGIRDYHYDCYVKTRGPRCAHCGFPLSKIDLDKNISGRFIIYEGKKYHVECYEQYAGPRCSYCFNVIIESHAGDQFSGCWVGVQNKMFHEECFNKKKQSEERAMHS